MLQEVLKKHWGFDSFLPLQEEAMRCALEGRDSLVVMPTGGGKSLCYQAPALCREGLAVVVSPLIALMKDQVDALVACGIPAAAVNSSMAADERRAVAREIEAGRLRLLYVSPEKLLTERMLQYLERRPVTFFAVDEAHCVSAWGHDFRPEYRDLRRLRERFPQAALHAYTATATEPVRRDVAEQLGLRDPRVLVGDFHRRNLRYSVARRERGLSQICSLLDRFRGESGIIYCITRAEVERTSTLLADMGYKAVPYHAGMSDADRTRNQEAFLSEQIDTIVATIAFGMGIDKSNVRYVVHAGMPKSLENYQQESGRAGRDGAEAECLLLYSAGDLMSWKNVIKNTPGEARAAAEASLEGMYSYCTSVTCRHAGLVEHFGQTWNRAACEACDVCLGKLETVDDALVIGQKILSCVLRVKENFGGSYVAQVLCGSREQRIVSNGHDRLSTWGLLKEHGRGDVRDWIEQLVGQGYAIKDGEFNVLRVTEEGRRLLRGERTPMLLSPAAQERAAASASFLDSWEGVDRGLFDALRALRREQAMERGVPAYIVFADTTLRDMARRRPSSVEGLLEVHGVGRQKAEDFGETFVAAIAAYCSEQGVAADQAVKAPPPRRAEAPLPSAGAIKSFPLFAEGRSVEDAAQELGRAVSTTYGYLESYIRHRRITDADPWLPRREFEQIEEVVQGTGSERLKPIFEALSGRVSYERIRIAVACLQNRSPAPIDTANSDDRP